LPDLSAAAGDARQLGREIKLNVPILCYEPALESSGFLRSWLL